MFLLTQASMSQLLRFATTVAYGALPITCNTGLFLTLCTKSKIIFAVLDA